MIEVSLFILAPWPSAWKFGPSYNVVEASAESPLAAKALTLWLLFIGVQVTVYY